MKKMRLTIGRDGRTQIRVEGAVGDECLEFTRLVEGALGIVERRTRLTAAAAEPVRIATHVRQRT